MGVCGYCRQKTGWFSNAHDGCAKRAKAGIESVKKCMADAVVQGKHYGEVSATIRGLIADAAIPQDQANAALKDGWSEAVEQKSQAQPVSNDEYDAILGIYREAGLAAGSTIEEWISKSPAA